MVGFSDLLKIRPQALAQLADHWEQLAETVSRHHEDLRARVSEPLRSGGWSGPASATAQQHVAGITGQVAQHPETIRQVATTLRTSAVQIAAAQVRLNRARMQAAQYGVDIDEQGAVSVDPTKLIGDVSNLPTVVAAARSISGEINGALSDANDADQHAAATLRRLTPKPGSVQPAAHTAPPQPQIAAAGTGDSTDPATLGFDDAQNLRAAMNAKPPDRATIDAIAADLEKYKNDPNFLQGFFANGGADDLSQLAAVLEKDDHHGPQDPLLGTDSQTVLSEAADALAGATKLPASDTWDPSYLDPLRHPSDDNMWSVGMLLKCGPKGSQWDSGFLKDLGASMLDWRQRVRQRPDYNGTGIFGAVNYTDNEPDGLPAPNWWNSLGISFPTDNMFSSGDDPANLAQLEQFDPAQSILHTLGQNPAASASLVSGPNGEQYAKQLMDPYWGTPGPTFHDESQNAASVITAATGVGASSDPAGTPQQYAQAAANVFNAVNDIDHNHGDMPAWVSGDFDDPKPSTSDAAKFEHYPATLPPGMQRGLAAVASGYVTDLGRSATDPYGDTSTYPPPSPKLEAGDAGRPTVLVDRQVVNSIVHEISGDPTAAGTFKGAIYSAIAHAANAQTANPHSGSPAAFTDLGTLAGMQDQAIGDRHYTDANNIAMQKAQQEMVFNTVIGAAANNPIGGWGNIGLAAAGPVLDQILFGDPNQGLQEVSGQQDAYMQHTLDSINASIGQGALASGQLHPPPASWWHEENGQMVVTDQDGFWNWWRSQGESQQQTDWETDATNGYQNPNIRYVPPPTAG